MQTDHTPELPQAHDRLFVWPAADAYVKPVDQEGKRVYAIHDAEGRHIAVARSRELAFSFIAQQEAEGADAH